MGSFDLCHRLASKQCKQISVPWKCTQKYIIFSSIFRASSENPMSFIVSNNLTKLLHPYWSSNHRKCPHATSSESFADRQVKWNLEKPLQSDDGTEYSHIPLHTEEQDEFNFVTVLNCKCGRNAWQVSRRVRVHSAWQAGVSLSQMRCEGWTNHRMQVKSSSRCHPDTSQWGKQESRQPLWPKQYSPDQIQSITN